MHGLPESEYEVFETLQRTEQALPCWLSVMGLEMVVIMPFYYVVINNLVEASINLFRYTHKWATS